MRRPVGRAQARSLPPALVKSLRAGSVLVFLGSSSPVLAVLQRVQRKEDDQRHREKQPFHDGPAVPPCAKIIFSSDLVVLSCPHEQGYASHGV